MKIALYHPNAHFMGGGEYVLATVAQALTKHDITIYCTKQIDSSAYERFFGISLSHVRIVQMPGYLELLPHTIRPYFMLKWFYTQIKNMDVVIDTATNGWFNQSLKMKTICYVHFPFFFAAKKGWKSCVNRFVITKDNAFVYDNILCNSRFTQHYLQEMGVSSQVVYPPVDTSIEHQEKIHRIVSIGRFSADKKLEILIDAYKKGNFSMPLHIIGAYNDASIYDQSYIKKLTRMAEGFDIIFHFNMPHHQVLNFLAKSTHYWHARGYGETDPHTMENFGITTVEAMAAGCIPIVINKGAQPEIVQHNKNGYVWDTIDQLIDYTKHADRKLAHQAIKRAQDFSKEKFIKQIKKSVEG